MGSKNSTSLIFGHSHVWSIKRALGQADYAPQAEGYESRVLLCGTNEFPGSLISFSDAGKEMINPCLLSQLNQIKDVDPSRTTLVSMVQGNYYNIVGLVQDGEAFDFVIPGREELPMLPDAKIIPFGAIWETVERETLELEAFLRRLTKLKYAGVIHVNAPPPIKSSEFIREELAKKGSADSNGIQVTDPAVRLKLWIVQRRVLETLGRRLKFSCIHFPPDTVEGGGFLRKPFWKDAVHANEKYAALLLRQIEERTLEIVNAETVSV
jgi:hypothetical protein